MSNPTALVQKLWNYCNILRDDGLSYGVAEVERRLSVMEKLESVVTATLTVLEQAKLLCSEWAEEDGKQ